MSFLGLLEKRLIEAVLGLDLSPKVLSELVNTVPSIVLPANVHQLFTNLMRDAIEYGVEHNRNVIDRVREALGDFPEALEAIDGWLERTIRTLKKGCDK